MGRLAELRKEKGLYQKDVAQLLGIERTTYSRYETGDTQPSHENLVKLADFYDVSVDYLLGRSNAKRPPAGGEAAAGNTLRIFGHGGVFLEKELSDEAFRDVVRYIEFIESKGEEKKE